MHKIMDNPEFIHSMLSLTITQRQKLEQKLEKIKNVEELYLMKLIEIDYDMMKDVPEFFRKMPKELRRIIKKLAPSIEERRKGGDSTLFKHRKVKQK